MEEEAAFDDFYFYFELVDQKLFGSANFFWMLSHFWLPNSTEWMTECKTDKIDEHHMKTVKNQTNPDNNNKKNIMETDKIDNNHLKIDKIDKNQMAL